MAATPKDNGKADIGVTGLAVMGSNLARNFAHKGFVTAVHNRTQAKTDALIAEHGDDGTFVPSSSTADFVASLARPRKIIIMVKAGDATDAVIDEIAPLLEDGDILIDGGNAKFSDTIRREAALRDNGVHFVKMVHNGIEYADMQLIAEAYDLLRRAGGLEPAEIAEVFKDWNSGELDSFLIEITAQVLAHVDATTGKPFVDVVLDAAGMKGTGTWTVQTALDLGIPVSGIAEAVFARGLSSSTEQRAAAVDVLPEPETPWQLKDRDTFVEDVRRALYASKIVAYAQG